LKETRKKIPVEKIRELKNRKCFSGMRLANKKALCRRKTAIKHSVCDMPSERKASAITFFGRPRRKKKTKESFESKVNYETLSSKQRAKA
jgi:hypothetical protein